MWPFSILSPYCIVFYGVAGFLLLSEKSPLRYHGKFIIFYTWFLVQACIFIPFIVLTSPFNQYDNARKFNNIARHAAKLIGVKFELENPEILTKDYGGVLVSNHQSTLDILGLMQYYEIQPKIAPVAKKALFWALPLGVGAMMTGIVFIDRSSREKAYETLKTTSRLINTQKVKVWMFPEGTRNRDINRTRKIKPFKRGAFTMAVESQAPIIPLVFSPYYFKDQRANYFKRGSITLRMLEPIPTTGLTDKDIPALMEKTHAAMQTAFDDLCALVEARLPVTHPFTVNKFQS